MRFLILRESESVIYLFPGLGASEKLFQPFTFFPFESKVVSFLIPEKKETLDHYSDRLSAAIVPDEENIYIGVSFGGILAQEIAKKFPPGKIILISSIKAEQEKPAYFKLIRRFPIYRLISASVLKKILVFGSEMVTHKTTEEKKRFKMLVEEANEEVIKWGITQVINWKPQLLSTKLFHIHGDKDIVFPIKKIKAHYIIPNGTHFMIMREIKEINEVIMSHLQTISV